MAKTKSYGQYCPVAQAAEIVTERWTLLIVRELLCGSRRFNDLRKGVPLISPSLLSHRLRELDAAGVVVRIESAKGSGSAYELTRAGKELQPLIEMLGLWGHRWVQREVRREELDPSLLMWDMRRSVDPQAFPADRRKVIQFDVCDVPSDKSRWWLVFERGDVDLCLKHPGHEVDLQVTSDIRTLVAVWLGRMPLRDAVGSEAIRIEGARTTIKAFEKCFRLSLFARLSAAEVARARKQPREAREC